MALIPVSDAPRQEFELVQDLPRSYLGMSQVGNPCKRASWYYFRWAYVRHITQRELRIFERGHLEEPRVIRDLTNWGWRVVSTQENYEDIFGHFKGHSDCVIERPDGEVLLLEIKTMNDKAFADLLKKGMKASKPLYYAQAQLYMHYSAHKQALFVVLNKNTEARHYCLISYDKAFAEDLVRVAEDIIAGDIPDKIGGPSWFECKFCSAYEVCHFNEPWLKTCRTCVSGEIHDEGRWYCTRHDKFLSIIEQREGCEQFEVISAGRSTCSE